MSEHKEQKVAAAVAPKANAKEETHATWESKVKALEEKKMHVKVACVKQGTGASEADLEADLAESLEVETRDCASDALKCVDGRGTHAEFGCPGGDLGEFLVAVNAYQVLGGTREDIKTMMAEYIATTPKDRHFYFHSGDHAMHHLMHKLHTPHEHHFDLTKVPKDQQSKVLAAFDDPEVYGCGHVKLQMTHSAEYKTNKVLPATGFKAALECLWDEKLAPRMELEILTGDHGEKAVTIIDGPTPAKTVEMIPSKRLQSFVYHPSVVAERRAELAAYFVKQPVKTNATPLTTEALLKVMNEIGGVQLTATLSHLAGKLPQYSVTLSA